MREKELIKISFLNIIYYCGIIALVAAGIILLPLLILPFYPSEIKYVSWFLYPATFSALVGLIIVILFRSREKIPLSQGHSSIVVVFAWFWSCILGGIPLTLHPEYSLLHGMFESVSGWCGCGLTVIDTTKVPNLILMWRSITEYLGGAGFAVIMFSILSGPSSFGVFKSEGHENEIFPHIKKTAQIVMGIYLTFLLVGSVAYVIVGMSPFDAVNHCMAALGTGGFSTKNASIGYYNSVPIEIVTIILMLLGQTSFTTHYYIFRGKIKLALKNDEIKSSIVILFVLISILFFAVTMPLYVKTPFNPSGGIMQPYVKEASYAYLKAAFESISAISGTGFTSVKSYIPWGALGAFIIFLLMCSGGHTNSTSGGIKMMRLYLVGKSIIYMIRDQFIPQSAVSFIHIDKGERRIYVSNQLLRDLFNFVTIYVFALIVGSTILMIMGNSMQNAIFEYASAQGCVGLTIGVTSPTAPPLTLLTLMFGMFFGRLEFFVVFYCIIKIFSDAKFMTSKGV